MMPVRRTQNWLPSIFNDFFDNEWMAKANATAPAINVIESEKEYKVEVAAPGIQQTMILPDNVDKEKIAAQVENGVLTIDLPKLSEEEIKKPERTIEIK